MEKFRIAATGHSVNYLPEYLAKEFGYFEEENLSVDAIVPQPWTVVLDEIKDGSSQAALGGIWVPSMYRDRGHSYEPFAQLSARCPLVLVAREQDGPFEFVNVANRTVLMPGGNGSSPGIFFKFILSQAGINVDSVNFVQDLSGSMLAELFSGGMGDYLLIDPVSAARIVGGGNGYIASYLAEVGGPVPWSVYYADPASGPSHDAKVRFVRALDRAVQWLRGHDAEEISDFLVATYPSLSAEALVNHVNQLRTWGMWDTARIDRDSYDRWQQGIFEGHLVDAPIEYSSFVDSTVADDAGVGGVR